MPKLSGLALSRSALDRRAEHRSDQELAAYWADPRARVLPLVGGLAAVDQTGVEHAAVERPTGEPNAADRVPADRVPADRVPAEGDGSALVYRPAATYQRMAPFFLGTDTDSVPYFAMPVESTDEAGLPADARLIGLREVGFRLDAQDAGAYVHAHALARWHESHPHCAACGARTEITQGGHVRTCPACGVQHFPRTDPAIIVLVSDGAGRALLARNAQWPERRFSTIAGFVEPGEALEAAVIREVHEETGIEVTKPEYAGSQPWPFPASLMVGFFARACSDRIAVDEQEIAEARWFTREELRAGYASGALAGPTPGSIAGRLIRTWLEAAPDSAGQLPRNASQVGDAGGRGSGTIPAAGI